MCPSTLCSHLVGEAVKKQPKSACGKTQNVAIPGTVLIRESSTLGGPNFSSAISSELDWGLQPLKLQGLKPPIRGSFSSGLKSRPPTESRDANYFQIRTLLHSE